MDILVLLVAVLVPALRLTWLCISPLWRVAAGHWLGHASRRFLPGGPNELGLLA